MPELPPHLTEAQPQRYWNRKRLGLAIIVLTLLLTLGLVIALALFGPTICGGCGSGLFANIVSTL